MKVLARVPSPARRNVGGTGACVFSQKAIEPHSLGFWRCMLDVNTATSTGFTVKFDPAASDGVPPANTNRIYVWGGQADAARTLSAATSYIPAATATVTRSAESIHLPVDAAWFNPVRLRNQPAAAHLVRSRRAQVPS